MNFTLTNIEQKLINVMRTLEKNKDLAYQITATKEIHENVKDVSISVSIIVSAKDIDSDKYFKCLHDCHDDIKTIGFENISLTSTMAYANIWGRINGL